VLLLHCLFLRQHFGTLFAPRFAIFGLSLMNSLLTRLASFDRNSFLRYGWRRRLNTDHSLCLTRIALLIGKIDCVILVDALVCADRHTNRAHSK